MKRHKKNIFSFNQSNNQPKLKRGINMTSIKDQINSIISKRKELLPKINERLNVLNNLQSDIGILSSTINSLRNKEGIPEDIKQICDDYEHNTLSDNISSSIEALKQLEKRYNRSTINIGIAGKARVGKSTFLQTLSGLSESQIPTGSGLPVTATRSRIFNSTNKQATITFYSEYEFCNIVLKTFFDEIGLTDLPQTIDEFKNYVISKDDAGTNKKESLIVRLERMQKAIFSYKDYLGKGQMIFELDKIKPFVAYPSEKEEFDENGNYKDNCKRPYLAVKDVRIDCPFPENDVENLGIMDLPGLGETVPKDFINSFMNYRSEVDLVIVLTSPTERDALFNETDRTALDCAKEAKGPIKEKSDFSLIVINDGNVKEKALIMEKDIKNRFSNYKILKGDVKKSKELKELITSKILDHLAERLPVMDSDYERDSDEKINTIISDGNRIINFIKTIVSKQNQADIDVNEITEQAEELQEDLAVELQDLLKEYNEMVPNTGDFEKEVKEHYEAVEQWINSGLGYSSPEEWKTKAARSIKKHKGSGELRDNEFNKIRNFINHSYSSIDKYLDSNVKELRRSIAEILKECTSELVDKEPGDEYLRELSVKCSNTYKTCISMKEAIDTILNSNIEYRSHFHPKVRANLKSLYAQNQNPENVRAEDDEIENLYNFYMELAQEVNNETKNSILKEAGLATLILSSWLEDFEDKFIRDKDSDKEFRELVAVYKEQIWPEKYNKIISFREDLSKLSKIVDITKNDLEKLRSL